MTTSSPVTPSVLRWAVEEDGRSLPALAVALKVAPEDLRSWMSGEGQPTVGQVTALARVLKRPRAAFFLPKPPATALPAEYRQSRSSGQVSSTSRRWARRTNQAGAACAFLGAQGSRTCGDA